MIYVYIYISVYMQASILYLPTVWYVCIGMYRYVQVWYIYGTHIQGHVRHMYEWHKNHQNGQCEILDSDAKPCCRTYGFGWFPHFCMVCLAKREMGTRLVPYTVQVQVRCKYIRYVGCKGYVGYREHS